MLLLLLSRWPLPMLQFLRIPIAGFPTDLYYLLPNNIEEFKQKYKVEATVLFNHNAILTQRISHERDTTHTQLAATHETIDNLEEQLIQLNLDLNIARAASTFTVSVPIVAAPPPSTVSTFRSKNNEAANVIYAVSRLEGRDLDQGVPLINTDPAVPFSSITAFVAHLEASFGDPDLRSTTRHQLVALKEGKGDFATYYSVWGNANAKR
ncbi:uncharacterized protein H6S33_007217 [Morchella sextelata]|uniref:uncharacterized protein n=1 Tax=Morchella sextelata TaxID=1174677 RepID=UPI001D04103E|nr:uncharacterized protein H6S33_007217 [Morchella sextelata]KAH0604186.1 hypothetical protein H6S33_007217 [Morchella sextelata]